MHLMPRSKIIRNCMELSFCTASLLIGLPMSVALYKQQSCIKAEDLETKFQTLMDKEGKPVKEFYFNRGL